MNYTLLLLKKIRLLAPFNNKRASLMETLIHHNDCSRGGKVDKAAA